MKRLLQLAAAVLLTLSADAQYKLDFGIQLGGSNYLGDIGGREAQRRDFVWDMHLDQTNFVAGGYARYRINKLIAVHGNLTWLQLKDFDNKSTNPSRRARNLNFRNRILEFGGRAEITLFKDNDVGGRGQYNPDFRMYGFIGIAGFMHNPQAVIYNGETDVFGTEYYDLRPLKTEGQQEEYGKFGMAIPAGIGLYFTYNKSWRIGWELSWRTTFTDYIDDISGNFGDPANMTEIGAQISSGADQDIIDEIDDPTAGSLNDHRYFVNADDQSVSQRGNPDDNDSYLTSTFSIGYVIRGKSSFYRKRYSWLKNRVGARRSRAKF